MVHRYFKRIAAILIILLILLALVGTAAAAPRNYIVVFMFDDENYYKKTVPRFTVMSEIETPVRDGYTFGGWYTDRDCTQAYDFSRPVMEPFYLYAKWIPGDSGSSSSGSSNPSSNSNSSYNSAKSDSNSSSSSSGSNTNTSNSSNGSGSYNYSGKSAVLPIPDETLSKAPAEGRPEISDPINLVPDPSTLAFLIIAGLGAVLVAYFILLKS
ncbi:hypothetical protein MmiEs2_15320 [Methanimicrococcus stummii]|uniref:Uncharacterized protein n=1 Tax=Methanimicrococcus stummii TaxID=3028294 RepID=A0AA96VBD0_9EURY|nr:InlB B-repeat-containing protein [Methanimicrococcus sp. Es2]WNY29306.1 hypothetical protein MmiEs2_15320 [Methanimicrococcus sp. Es2]